MCGIGGFTRFTHSTGDEDTLQMMGQAIYHRGPDAGGVYLDDAVGLCHRRLAIIDLSDAGTQPMHSHDGHYVIAFNGEIYNFQPLRAELIADGYVFKSQTDTEVLMALYAKYGEAMMDYVHGMFAFALWDKRNKTLFIARDRLGKKPLYYYMKDDHFVFASELKSILPLDFIEKDIRADAVYDFFTYQYIPDPKTIFTDIYKLEPGHSLTVTAEGITKRQYWNVSFSEKIDGSSDDIASNLLNLIDENVKERMISDVPLGAFLSGGVDSSGITALMAKNSDAPVTTCSIGFDSKKFDEVKYALQVAEQYKTDHHELTVSENVTDKLETIVKYFDEPFADPSLVPTYFVSQLARQQVTVALAGDGGDESFAGYSKYGIDQLENNIRNRIPSPIRKWCLPVLHGVFKYVPGRLARKARTLLYTLSRSPAYGFFLSNSFLTEECWSGLVRPEFKTKLGGYHPSSVMLKHYEDANGESHLDKVLYTDIKTYLPGDILVKVDRMSMAHSLEVRAPLLDARIVEMAAKIPPEEKLKGKEKKHILKKAFSPYLSDDILYRKKMGFSVPLADWLRGEIKDISEKALFEQPTGISDFFNMTEVKRIWNAHQSKQYDYSSEIWSMVMFQLWYKEYMAG